MLVNASVAGLLIATIAWPQVAPGPGDHLWNRLVADAYAEHIRHLRDVLPKYSALPPMNDLSKSQGYPREASRAWENRFTGSMGEREYNDPGVSIPSQATSIALSTIEYASPGWALPVRECDAVVVGVPSAASVYMAYNQRFVYSSFAISIERVLKAKNRKDFPKGGQFIAAELGGTVRYLSGHEATFLLADRGFMELGKHYYLFVWKPVRSDQTYMTAEAYVVQGDQVFPVNLGYNESLYEKGLAISEFEARLKTAITKDADSN